MSHTVPRTPLVEGDKLYSAGFHKSESVGQAEMSAEQCLASVRQPDALSKIRSGSHVFLSSNWSSYWFSMACNFLLLLLVS